MITDQLRQSYPYLVLARERGLRYGDVLLAADFFSAKAPCPVDDHTIALVFLRMSQQDQQAIVDLMHELARTKGW